jgi:hypothetical protein
MKKKLTMSMLVLLVLMGGIASAAVIDRTIPGIISGSSQFGYHEAPRWVFDNRSDTKWLANGPTGWVQFEFLNNQAFAVNSYAITSANDDATRDPKVWTLLGSNDGTNWTTVDSRSGQSWAGRQQRRLFNCTNTTPYRIYRLNVTQNNGSANLMQFSELELIENGIPRTAYYHFSWSSQISNTESARLVLDKVMDGSKWLTASGQTTGWIQYRFLGKGAYAINGYAIASANDAPGRDPRDWTLQGSHDGTNWNIIDTRVGESWATRLTRREFLFNNAVAYSYYKLNVTANNGDTGLMGFSEFELLERDLAGGPTYVSPAENAFEVPAATPLVWQVGNDPNMTGQYVYLGTSPAQMTRLNSTALSVGTTTYAPTLATNSTYYWQIEEATNNQAAGDPNNIMGRVWRFSTETTLVIINPEYPVDTFADLGGSASFNVVVTDPLGGTISYQWYYDPDTEVAGNEVQLTQGSKYQGVNTATLTINNVQESDKGAYFCGATNTGLVVYSDTANLFIKTKLAHWTLDASSYNGTTYADATGLGHDATVDGTSPVFADGIVDGDENLNNTAANGAIDVADPNSCASAGSFNPSEETSAFSVSAWVKWLGTQDIVNGMIAAKRDGWAAATESYWIFMVNDAGVVRFQSYGATTLNTANGTITEGQWHHVAVTYEKGFARIYVDGMEKALGSFTLAQGPESTFWIGRNNALNERFDGLIDDLQVFNYALSPEDVADLQYAESGTPMCIYGNPVGDLTEDCKVTLDDFSVMAENWLLHGFYPHL